MNRNLGFSVCIFRAALAVLLVWIASSGAFAGTWAPLTHAAPGPVGHMHLLSNGTVMVEMNNDSGTYGPTWYLLTPDSAGHYTNGTWTTLASMTNTRLFFASQLLRDGRLFVAGGEYGTGGAAGEVYDPQANTWTALPAPGHTFSDANSEILPDGRVLVALVEGTLRSTLIYDPVANTWSTGPSSIGIHNESVWVKLPDNSILMVDRLSTNSERYIPSSNTWIADATVPVALYDSFGDETGPGTLLPNGKVIFFGAMGHTAIYTPSGNTTPGAWVAGPDIPNGQGCPDAPCAQMPDGKVLLTTAPIPISGNVFQSPTSFYEYDYTTNSFTQVNVPAGGLTESGSSFQRSMLVLPDGTVLSSRFGTQLYVYTPGGAPLATAKPAITGVTRNGDGSYHLVGTQLNGINEGACYGDDDQNSSNYPIVKLTAGSSVYYARTYNWSSTGVATGATPVTTEFTVPASVPAGAYSLSVIANGVASDPVVFGVGVPIVIAPTSASTSPTVAVLGGNVTSEGGAPVTERGVVYSLTSVNADPVIGGTGVTTVTSPGTTGVFTVNVTGLTAGVSYSFKAYATSSIGTTYTTPASVFAQGAPVVASPTSAGITATGATLGGNVTDDAGSPITGRGVVYSITSVNPDPTIGGTGVTVITNAGTTGVFTVNAAGLSPATGYSFKAYATNSAGTTYTVPAATFATLAQAPAVTSPTSASIAATSAVLGGNVTSDGGAAISERGVVYSVTSVNSDPVIGGSGVTKVTGTGTTGVFTVNATGLAASTGYSFKAYATNSVGTAYTTPAVTFSTAAATFLSGTKTVGAGGDFASLTNAGGLFDAININGVNGALTVQITGDLAGETGAVKLNAVTGASPSVKIFPIGSARAITGSSTGALICLNAADNITLDGSLGGSGTDRSLSITNTNTGTSSAVVWLQSSGSDGATNNTIKNLNVVGNGNTQTIFGIGVGSSTISILTIGTGNNGNTIQNNSISRTQYGIICRGASAAAKNTGNVIMQNLINTPSPNNVARGGILLGYQDSVQVTQNVIDGISYSSSTDAFGISLGWTAIAYNTFTGSEVTNATVTRNSIGKVTNTGTYSAVGIAVASAASGTTLIANNFIFGVIADATSPDVTVGIYLGGGTGSTTQVYFNSVSMTGSITGGSYPSYAIAIGGSNPVADIRNNILYTTQATGTAISYAIGTAATSYTNLTSDYNVFFTTTGSLFGVGKVGGLSTSGTTQTTLANWQATTGKDAHSIFGDPLFTSATNLHIASLSSPATNSGTPIGAVSNDFDGDARLASAPDIGADEFNAPPTLNNATVTNLTTSGATLGGNVTSDGGAPVTERGVVFSLTSVNGDPVIGGTGVTKVTASGTTGIFTANISGLSAGTGYSFKAYASNATGTAYTNPAATFTTLTAQQSWRQTYFGTTANKGDAADLADPDNDGLPNIVEFAFGLNPLANTSSQQLPAPQIVGGNYVVSFTQPAGVSGITYGVEWTPSLAPANWTPLADTGSGNTHAFSVPVAGNPSVFFRFVITAP